MSPGSSSVGSPPGSICPTRASTTFSSPSRRCSSEPAYRAADEVTVEITVDGRLIAVDIGPLDMERVAADLAQTEDGFGLRVLLAAVVDSFRLDGADLLRPSSEAREASPARSRGVTMATAQEQETRALLRAYHVDGDLNARDRLIELHLPLVRALARRYAGRSEQLDDLIQVGSIGLIKAVDRFDAGAGRRVDDLRDPDHHRRAQAALPRQGLGAPRAAAAQGALAPADPARGDAFDEARTVSDDRRAGQGCRGRRRRCDRGARHRPGVLDALAVARGRGFRPRSARLDRRSIPATTQAKTGLCSRRGSRFSKSENEGS